MGVSLTSRAAWAVRDNVTGAQAAIWQRASHWLLLRELQQWRGRAYTPLQVNR